MKWLWLTLFVANSVACVQDPASSQGVVAGIVALIAYRSLFEAMGYRPWEPA
jgi:hypothetical protein